MIKYILATLTTLLICSCQTRRNNIALADPIYADLPLSDISFQSDLPADIGVYTQISCTDFMFKNRVDTISKKICALLKRKSNFKLINVNEVRSSDNCDLVVKIDAVYQIINEHTIDAPINGRLYNSRFNWDVILINPKKGNILKKWTIPAYETQFRQPYWDDVGRNHKNAINDNAEHYLLSNIADTFNEFDQWDQTIAKAQGREKNTVLIVNKPKPKEVPKAIPKNYDRKSTALIIGISEYAFYSKISSSVNDANLMAKMMGDNLNIAPENIILLKDGAKGMNSPTKLILEERLRMICKETPEDGNLWVYLSGHGEIENGDLVFIPQDGKKGNKISISWLVAEMNKSKAAQKNLILDICHSDTDAKGVGIRKLNAPPKIDNKKTALFMSCKDGEFSYPLTNGSSSVYTKYFIEAIKAQKSSKIDINELQKSIDSGVRSWRLKHGRQQTPQLIQPK